MKCLKGPSRNYDTMRRTSISTTGTKDKSIEQVFKGRLEEKWPELRKDKLVHIQEAQSTKKTKPEKKTFHMACLIVKIVNMQKTN